MNKNVGFKFYTNHFGEECEVTRYWTDKHWWFYSKKHGREFKAGTRLSYFKGQEDQRARSEKSIQEMNEVRKKTQTSLKSKFRSDKEKEIDDFVQKHYGYKESSEDTREIARVIYDEYASFRVLYALETNMDLYDLDRWELVSRIDDLPKFREQLADEGIFLTREEIKKSFINFDIFIKKIVDPLYKLDIEVMEYADRCADSISKSKERELEELYNSVVDRTTSNN